VKDGQVLEDVSVSAAGTTGQIFLQAAICPDFARDFTGSLEGEGRSDLYGL
jgi:hypothetical protein